MGRERQLRSSRRLRPTGSVLGAGTDPVWHSSQLQAADSSLRSTLAHQDEAQPCQSQQTKILPAPPSTPSSQSKMSIQNLIHAESVMEEQSELRPAMFTPINSPGKRNPPKSVSIWTPIESPSGHNRAWKRPTDSELFAHHAAGHAPPPAFQIDMNEYHTPQFERHGKLHFANAESLNIDREDGRVYHMGHSVGEAYSGVFLNDRPETVPFQAQKKITQMKEEKERPLRVAQCAELLGLCRHMLDAGALLVLQRTSFVDYGESVLCCRPFCPSVAIPEDSYYLSLDWDDCLYTFCLSCFEMLWDGSFTEHVYPGPPEIPHMKRRDSGVAMRPSTSGTAPPYSPLTPPRGTYPDPLDDVTLNLDPSNEIYQSRHATPCEDVLTPGTFHDPGLDAAESWSSPGSCTSTGEWRHPPTRFQHIASFVTAGGTLSEIDTAVLALWKETSRCQLEWERYLRKKKYIRDYYDGRAEEDRSLDVEKLRVGQPWNEEDEGNAAPLEQKTGLRKKDCNGRDLSEVLKEIAVKENGGMK